MPRTETASATEPSTSAEAALLVAEVQHFYARQMHQLDAGRADAWAETFAPDGAFAVPGHAEPVRGRAALAAAAEAAAAEHAAQGLTRRHWLGMLTVDRRPDGRVLARSYALVLRTPTGGVPELHRSTVCTDLLRRHGGSWLVEHRQVSRDDLPADGPGATPIAAG